MPLRAFFVSHNLFARKRIFIDKEVFFMFENVEEFEFICPCCTQKFFRTKDSSFLCPDCGAEMELAQKCTFCGGSFLPADLTHGLCDDCINEEASSIQFDYYLSRKEDWNASVDIDLVLATVFSEEEINDILYREFINSGRSFDCNPFLDEYKYEFAEAFNKERGENYEGWKAKKDVLCSR